MACTKANSCSETPVRSEEYLLEERSSPFPRYFLMKSEYCWKVMYPSLSVSSSLKMAYRSSLLGLTRMK
jgi:hypothetical protein